MYPTLPKSTTLAIVLLFAVIQVIVHLCTSCTWTVRLRSVTT
jgi:heme/copper-type cytochrome/quinol oxidase subunit 4